MSEYIDEKSVLQFTKELVKAQSVTGEEKNTAELMANTMEPLGLKVQVDEVELGRPNVVGMLKGEVGRPVLIFNGHMDIDRSDCAMWHMRHKESSYPGPINRIVCLAKTEMAITRERHSMW